MGTINESGVVAGIALSIIFGFVLIIGVGFGIYSGKLPLDAGMAIFITLVTFTNFGLSSFIGSINDVNSKKNALISLIALNSITIIGLLLYLGITTYTAFQKTSIQNSYRYIHVLIPVCVVVSIVSLSATAMKQLTRAHCK